MLCFLGQLVGERDSSLAFRLVASILVTSYI